MVRTDGGGVKDLDIGSLRRAVARQELLVRGLQSTLYNRPDPSEADPELQRRLAEAEATLLELRQQERGVVVMQTDVRPVPAVRGRLLSLKTTQIKVESTLHMHPIPTGVYHLLDAESDPLLTVNVANNDRSTRRICVRAYLEGLSAQTVRTVEVEPRSEVVLKLLPTLLPERARAISEIQRATLHVIAEDLDGKLECHDTFTVTCLARSTGLNSSRRPETGKIVDLTRYYGARVTPHVEAIQKTIRRAADLSPERQIWGYQGHSGVVTRQVEALYNALKETQIAYVNSVIDFGAPPGQASQRTSGSFALRMIINQL